MISSGVPILEGLDITARTSGNAVVEKAIMQTRKAVEAGRSLVEPLKETDVFPGMVTQMIGVGEQTGAMDAMLQKIADFYEDEVDAAVKDMLTAIEPIMIVFLGVVVGGVVISMYLPLFSLIGKLVGPLKSRRHPPGGRHCRLPGFESKETKYRAECANAEHANERRDSEWLPWLGRVRFLIITLLVMVVVAVQPAHPHPTACSHAVSNRDRLWYTLAILYVVLHRWLPQARWQRRFKSSSISSSSPASSMPPARRIATSFRSISSPS